MAFPFLPHFKLCYKVRMPFDPVLRHMIAGFRKSSQWDSHLDLELLRKLWPTLAGSKLAAATEIVAIHGSRVVVNVPDQIWRKQLITMRRELLARMNEPWPAPWITEIVFTYEN
jgi:predicted nucleic acid-binding Zn ribbon protein